MHRRLYTLLRHMLAFVWLLIVSLAWAQTGAAALIDGFTDAREQGCDDGCAADLPDGDCPPWCDDCACAVHIMPALLCEHIISFPLVRCSEFGHPPERTWPRGVPNPIWRPPCAALSLA